MFSEFSVLHSKLWGGWRVQNYSPIVRIKFTFSHKICAACVRFSTFALITFDYPTFSTYLPANLCFGCSLLMLPHHRFFKSLRLLVMGLSSQVGCLTLPCLEPAQVSEASKSAHWPSKPWSDRRGPWTRCRGSKRSKETRRNYRNN